MTRKPSRGDEQHDLSIATRFRARADTLRAIAATLQSPANRQHLLDAAQEWEDLASSYERTPIRTAKSPRRADHGTLARANRAAAYRFFLFDRDNHAVRMRNIDCTGDDEAARIARQVLKDEDPAIVAVEAWDGEQQIARAERMGPRP